MTDILISKNELIMKVEQARANAHKRAKDLDAHYEINAYVDSFLAIVNECTAMSSVIKKTAKETT